MKLILLMLSLFFLFSSALNSSAGITEINEFENYTAEELLVQFDNLSWTSNGVQSSKVVYVIGAPWCPATKRIYNFTKNKNKDIQYRYIMVSADNGREVLQNKLLAKMRDPKLLESFFANGSIKGQDSIGAQIAHDANFETIEKFKDVYEKRFKRGFGYPTNVFYTKHGWETDWQKLGEYKERPTDAKNIKPLCASIAEQKIKEYQLPAGRLVTKSETFFYAYPSTKATKLFSFSPELIVEPLAIIELEDKTIWVKTAAHAMPGGYKTGGWTQMENLTVM